MADDGRTDDDDGRTDDGPWLYYKLTNEPKGSGELTKIFVSNDQPLFENMAHNTRLPAKNDPAPPPHPREFCRHSLS